MSRNLQRGLAGGLLALALALALHAPEPAPAEPTPAPADMKPYSETIGEQKVTFKMVPIPGGTFLMGSPESEKGRDATEGPQHPVTIAPFWMAETEITWDLYDIYRREKGVENNDTNLAILKEKPDAVTGPTPPYADETFGHGRDDNPALCITWHACTEFCRWLSEKTGKLYRLPTEAEWEYAARAGTKTAYFFGDDPAMLGEYAWFAGNSDDLCHKVKQKKPNPWGLYDMYGNVMEWCIDQYEPEAYKQFSLDKPTLGPVVLPGDRRFSHVARGGSWADQAAQCRSASRRGSDKSWIKLDPQRPQSIWWLTSADFVGFRIVRPLTEQANLKGFRSKVTRQSN
jgi:formylglycine-generating enzyme required for sulfatase activity